MSISINWQPILGVILILVGIGWSAVQAWQTWRSRPVRPISRPAKTDAQPSVPPQRSADEGPPPGAQEWVVDIAEAMGIATAETKLTALRGRMTRDQARELRIAELEGKFE
jgi:hypothetical protein